jgi:hypothetical protein
MLKWLQYCFVPVFKLYLVCLDYLKMWVHLRLKLQVSKELSLFRSTLSIMDTGKTDVMLSALCYSKRDVLCYSWVDFEILYITYWMNYIFTELNKSCPQRRGYYRFMDWKILVIGAFAYSRKVPVSFIISVRYPSVCPHISSPIQLEGFPWNFIMRTYMKVCR